MKVRRIVAMLYEAQGGKCGSCGGRMALPGEPCDYWMLPTVDHVWPLARYGADHDGNKMLMHLPCNGAKADRPPNGCERLMHELVLARLGMCPADIPAHVTMATPSTMAEAFHAAMLAA